MSPILRRNLLASIHCPNCDDPMHADAHKEDALTRIVMCENNQCDEFGFAWTYNILTGIGESERPVPEGEFYRPPHPVTPGGKKR